MGHWSESLLDQVAQQIGGSPDRRVLTEVIERAGHEIEVLSGRCFRPAHVATAVIDTNGLPFVDVPDMQLGTLEPPPGTWALPDPVHAGRASVLQVASLAVPSPTAIPVADALFVAGQVLAHASRTGRLSADFVVRWLGSIEPTERMQLMREVMDPDLRFNVPILAAETGGWWIQISRRLIWVTNETPDEGRLLEPVLGRAALDEEAVALVAAEPVMVVARMSRQPSDWALSARVWTQDVRRPVDRPWSKIAKAIHGYGVPTITLDTKSTPHEIACQVLLKCYWHGYIGGNEAALARAVANAYPRQVDRIQRVTRAPSGAAAATTLLEQLIRPGFDPAQGAEATRRYVHRKASITVMEYRKIESPDRYPWTQIGISERRYYKLLPLFAEKVNGRYDVDLDDVITRMKDHLRRADHMREVGTLAMRILRDRGFSDAAARKWLQRHPHHEAVNAQPRGRRA